MARITTAEDVRLLVEVVDIHTGVALPCGQLGEVVITTLSREAMPLLRYRTGDAATGFPAPAPAAVLWAAGAHRGALGAARRSSAYTIPSQRRGKRAYRRGRA